MENYKVYIKVDSKGRIVEVNSSAFLMDTPDYIEIDSGTGDKYHHAQGHYFGLPLSDENGCRNYMYNNGMIRLATDEEKEQEIAERPEPQPTPTEDVYADMAAAIMQGVNEV